MYMDIEKLKQLIKLAKEEQVIKIEVKDQNIKYAVTLDHPRSSSVSHMITPSESRQGVREEQIPIVSDSKSKDTDLFEVKSPFVGTFYESPSPGAAPFVKIGDKVSLGQTLCILEAMKIMNEIDADVDGEICEVCVENESLVEYDQVLFKIKS